MTETANGTTYVEPAFGRSLYIEWDPKRIRAAEMLAETGSLLWASDLCDALMGDEDVQACLDNRTRALLGSDLTFEEGKGRKKRAATKALEQEEDWWKQFPNEQLVNLGRWGALLNIAHGPIQWSPDADSDRVLGLLNVWHPRWLRWNGTDRQWMVTVGSGGEIPIVPGDGKWMLFTPRGSSRPWMNGAWRAIARWWLLKQYAIADWGKYSERHGSGTWVGSSPQGARKEDRAELAKDLKQMGGNGAIAMPPGYDLKLVESVANTWQTFQAQMQCASKGITVALTGSNVTNEEGGSYAKAVFLGGVRLEIIKADDEALSATIHDQHLVYWAEFNFGSRKVAGWPCWAVDPPEDLKTKADTLVSLSQALYGLKEIAPGVDVETILEDYDVPMLTPAELAAELAAKAAQAALNPAPAPPNKADAKAIDGEVPVNDVDGKSPPANTPAPAPAEKAITAVGVAKAKAGEALPAGQAFIDRQVATQTQVATKAIAGDLDEILSVVKNADSFADLKKQLKTKYAAMNPKALAKVIKNGIILAQLAGRYAVQEES